MLKVNRHGWLSVVLLVAGVFLSVTSHADPSFPTRPVKMVVPYAAGGGTDVMARLVAREMEIGLKQPIVIDNRSGASGILGADIVSKSQADGYTILMGTASTHAINPNLYAKLPYDAEEGFTPIALIARVPGIVVVNSKSSIKSLRELIAEMKKNPGKISYGSQGLGGFSHLMGEMLNHQAGVKSLHVPYRGGALAVQDLLAGNVDIVYDTLPAVLPHIQSGALRALVITSGKRAKALPLVPTSAEEGYPSFIAETWNALFGPTGLPITVRNRLTDAAVTAVQAPAVRERIIGLSAEPIGTGADALKNLVASDRRRWGDVAKAANVRLD